MDLILFQWIRDITGNMSYDALLIVHKAIDAGNWTEEELEQYPEGGADKDSYGHSDRRVGI